jgi:peptide/nickel transport system ATP-binding protein
MLQIRELRVAFGGRAVVTIDELDIGPGGRLGLVGESGSGKTMTAMSIIRLLPADAEVSGSVLFRGREMLTMGDKELSRIRGAEIGVVFQDPNRALNPMMRIGRQLGEAIRLHRDLNRRAVRQRTVELLEQVQLPEPQRLLRRYPHQLSGGQQQRVLIAMAIACDPKLLIADEPTTALDVTVQAEILRLITRLSTEREMGLLFVSHDLGVVQNICERVAVMYGGEVMELGPTADVIEHARHRYTSALLGANPGIPEPDQLEANVGRRLQIIRGSVPAFGDFPSGCRFRNRCDHVAEPCVTSPVVTEDQPGHRFRCWNPTEEAG